MKLRNKRTGEIVEVASIDVDSPTEGIAGFESFNRKGSYSSIAELNAEWEDYEEPNKYWCISQCGDIVQRRKLIPIHDEDMEAEHKEIGNYFVTKEEAERVVEKLKAWKRLKDKGFEFNKWTIPEEPKAPHIKLVIEAEMDVPDSPYGLNLLFGGEDE